MWHCVARWALHLLRWNNSGQGSFFRLGQSYGQALPLVGFVSCNAPFTKIFMEWAPCSTAVLNVISPGTPPLAAGTVFEPDCVEPFNCQVNVAGYGFGFVTFQTLVVVGSGEQRARSVSCWNGAVVIVNVAVGGIGVNVAVGVLVGVGV